MSPVGAGQGGLHAGEFQQFRQLGGDRRHSTGVAGHRYELQLPLATAQVESGAQPAGRWGLRGRSRIVLVAARHVIAGGEDVASSQVVSMNWNSPRADDVEARDGAKLRSVAHLRASLERDVFPALGAMPIEEIKRSQIVRLLDAVQDSRGPVAANRALAMLRRIMNWHATRSDDFRSPIVRGMARPEQARDRVLSDDEIRAVWKATDVEVPNLLPGRAVFAGLVRFLLLTAARRMRLG